MRPVTNSRALNAVWFGWCSAFWMTEGLSFLFLIVFSIRDCDPREDTHLSPIERDYILADGAVDLLLGLGLPGAGGTGQKMR